MVEIQEITLSATPTQILWIDELRVIVSLPKSFCIVHVQSGLIQDFFAAGTGSFLTGDRNKVVNGISLIDARGLLLSRDSKYFFIVKSFSLPNRRLILCRIGYVHDKRSTIHNMGLNS